MVDDPTSIDVQPGEERLVEDRANHFVTTFVSGLGCVEQRQSVMEDLTTAVEMMLGIGQGALDLGSLAADGVDLGP